MNPIYSRAGWRGKDTAAFAYSSLANKGNSVCMFLCRERGEMGRANRFMRPLEDPLCTAHSHDSETKRVVGNGVTSHDALAAADQ